MALQMIVPVKVVGRRSYIHTVGGRLVDPLALQASDIDITDVAHALSNQCRFSGHTTHFYSVAQHCCIVSDILPPALRLAGLLHDATEAYLSDIASPLKSHETFGREYRQAESRAEAVIARRFAIPYPHPEEIKTADMMVLATEVRDLMSTCFDEDWTFWIDAEPLPWTIEPWYPSLAYTAFMLRYRRLIRERDL